MSLSSTHCHHAWVYNKYHVRLPHLIYVCAFICYTHWHDYRCWLVITLGISFTNYWFYYDSYWLIWFPRKWWLERKLVCCSYVHWCLLGVWPLVRADVCQEGTISVGSFKWKILNHLFKTEVLNASGEAPVRHNYLWDYNIVYQAGFGYDCSQLNHEPYLIIVKGFCVH